MWAVAAVQPLVAQVQMSQVEGLPTGVAGERLALAVTLLMCPQGTGTTEALHTGLTAEWFDTIGLLPAGLPSVWAVMGQLLVFLQLAVVEEGLPAQVAHERLLHAVDQHVVLQSPGPREALSTLVTPKEEAQG